MGRVGCLGLCEQIRTSIFYREAVRCRTVRRHQDHVVARRAQHFPEIEVCSDVSERPIVGVEPAMSTDQRATESGSGEESSAATAATNAAATNEQTTLNNTSNSVIPTTP